jgi:hypothetical protein
VPSDVDISTIARETRPVTQLVVGGYGRLCLVKDGVPGLCGPYAAAEIGHLSEKYSKSALGSGPRGRWFESTRPDQNSKNLRKSAEFSPAGHSGFLPKSRMSNRGLRTSNVGFPQIVRHSIGQFACHPREWSSWRAAFGLKPYAHLMLIGTLPWLLSVHGVSVSWKFVPSRAQMDCER